MKGKHALPPLRMYHFSSVMPMIFPCIIPCEYQCCVTRLRFLLLSNLISGVAQKALCYGRVEISEMAENSLLKNIYVAKTSIMLMGLRVIYVLGRAIEHRYHSLSNSNGFICSIQ